MNKQVLPGNELSYASIGARWANVANTPYQLWKAESYEGGVHTPMIAFWPKGITTAKGSFSSQKGHVMDFMRTFIELAGTRYPTSYKGHNIQPTTGLSLTPTFAVKVKGHDTLFNEHNGARYARLGDWKLVAKDGEKAWHLFNLANDKSETNDLANAYPSKVSQLDSIWKRWTVTHQVYPKPQPDKK